MASKQIKKDSAPEPRRPPFTVVPLLSSAAASASSTSFHSTRPLLTHSPTNDSIITASPSSGSPTTSFPYFPGFSSLLPLKKLQKRKLAQQAQRGVLYSKDDPVEEDVKTRGVIRIWEREICFKHVKKDEGLGSLERYKRTTEKRRKELNPDDEEDEDNNKEEEKKDEGPDDCSMDWPRWRVF